MEKWWKVKKGVAMSEAAQAKAVSFLMAWIGYHLQISLVARRYGSTMVYR